jgi:ketosteroid isomerase-like protein
VKENVVTNTPQSTALETASAYHRSWTSGALDGALAHVADDIICRAPDGDITGKDAYRSYLGGFSQMMTGLTDVAAFGDDEHALLFYYPHTAVTSTAPAAEHFTIRDGKIVESRLVFDRLSFGSTPQQ